MLKYQKAYKQLSLLSGEYFVNFLKLSERSKISFKKGEGLSCKSFI